MKSRAETHLFGSHTGYSCLAHSTGLTDSELQQLGTLGFGQMGDQRYQASLASEPAGYCRRLSSGRFAITRCFAGKNDDAGRATLELRTIVVESGVYDRLSVAGLDHLMHDAAFWERERFEGTDVVDVDKFVNAPRRPVDMDDLIVLDCWLQALGRDSTLAVLPDESRFRTAILRLPQVLDPKDRFDYLWGVRMLSTGTGVHVATLATGASRSGRRQAIEYSPQRGLRSPALVFLSEKLRNGAVESLPPVKALLSGLEQVSHARSGPAASNGRASSPRRRWIVPAAFGGGLTVIIALVVWGALALNSDQAGRHIVTADPEEAHQPVDVPALTREQDARSRERLSVLRSEVDRIVGAVPSEDARPIEQAEVILDHLGPTRPQHIRDIRDRISGFASDGDLENTITSELTAIATRLDEAKNSLRRSAAELSEQYRLMLERELARMKDADASQEEGGDETTIDEEIAPHLEGLMPWFRAWARVDGQIMTVMDDIDALSKKLAAAREETAVADALGDSDAAGAGSVHHDAPARDSGDEDQQAEPEKVPEKLGGESVSEPDKSASPKEKDGRRVPLMDALPESDDDADEEQEDSSSQEEHTDAEESEEVELDPLQVAIETVRDDVLLKKDRLSVGVFEKSADALLDALSKICEEMRRLNDLIDRYEALNPNESEISQLQHDKRDRVGEYRKYIASTAIRMTLALRRQMDNLRRVVNELDAEVRAATTPEQAKELEVRLEAAMHDSETLRRLGSEVIEFEKGACWKFIPDEVQSMARECGVQLPRKFRIEDLTDSKQLQVGRLRNIRVQLDRK